MNEYLCIAIVLAIVAIAWWHDRRFKKAIGRYVWCLRESSNTYMKASFDPSMSEALRTLNHARALEADKIAKEIDLLILGGAVAYEVFCLRGVKSAEKKTGEVNGSENKTTG